MHGSTAEIALAIGQELAEQGVTVTVTTPGEVRDVDDYDADEVPPATDTPPLTQDVRQTEQYQEERAEFVREYEQGELHPIDEDHPFPPTRYDD